MPVMMGGVFLSGHLGYWNYAALQRFAANVLELDGGVGDLEMLLEHVVEFDQNA